MKHTVMTAKDFKAITDEFKKYKNLNFELFKTSIIGVIIDECFYEKKAIVINNVVYTLKTNKRSGELYKILKNIDGNTLSEWVCNVVMLLV